MKGYQVQYYPNGRSIVKVRKGMFHVRIHGITVMHCMSLEHARAAARGPA